MLREHVPVIAPLALASLLTSLALAAAPCAAPPLEPTRAYTVVSRPEMIEMPLAPNLGAPDVVAENTDVMSTLAAACRETGTVVEVSEAWRCPSARLMALLRAAQVTLVPASDARYAAEVGSWQYVRRV